MVVRRALALLVAVLAAALGAVLPAVPALAEQPLTRLDGSITDPAGAITDPGSVQAAIDRTQAQTGVQLWVVYVKQFDNPSNAQQWAEQTAQNTSLGTNDVLLAVATDGRAYAYNVGADSALSQQELATIATQDVEPQLRAGNWDAAAIAMADGITKALAPSGFPWLWLLVGAAVLGGGTWLLVRSMRRHQAAPAAVGPGGAPDPRAAVPTAELAQQANRLLVEVDDAVKTSDQELQFAIAQFGEEAAAPFAQDIEWAKGELSAAFRLKQQLDDREPETEPQQRAMYGEIIDRLTAVDQRLDARAADFDKLRQMEANAPQIVAGLQQMRQQVGARVSEVEAALADLSARYPAGALDPIRGAPQEIQQRLSFASQTLAAAEADLTAGRTGQAAAKARAVEDALLQAQQLADVVVGYSGHLDEAARQLQEAVAESQRDLAEAANAPRASQPELAAEVATVRSALEAASAAVASGRFDPLAVLKQVQDADAALEKDLQVVRDAEAKAARAAAQLGETVPAAQARVQGVDSYISTHRAAIGADARTRIAEARRLLDQAMALQGSDPVQALASAQRALALADEAAQLAENDVRGSGYGGYGGGDGRPPVVVSRGPDLGSILLGQILLGSMTGGGGGGRPPGGGNVVVGGGGFGGGFGPGSFGGSGTRGRRGGGGRF